MIDIKQCKQFTIAVGGTTLQKSVARYGSFLTDRARALFEKDSDKTLDEPGEATFIVLKVGQLLPGKGSWQHGLLFTLDLRGDESLAEWSKANLGEYTIRLCQKTDVVRVLPHYKDQPIGSILYIAMKLIRDGRGSIGPRAFMIDFPKGGKRMIDVCGATRGHPTRPDNDVLFRLIHA